MLRGVRCPEASLPRLSETLRLHTMLAQGVKSVFLEKAATCVILFLYAGQVILDLFAQLQDLWTCQLGRCWRPGSSTGK